MSSSSFLALLVLALVFFLPVRAADHVGAAGPIVAGKRLGDVYLKEVQPKVIDKLGKPAARDMAMGREICVWHLFGADNPTRLDVLFFRDDTTNQLYVTEVRVNSNAFGTSHGLAVGSSVADLLRIYPSIEKRHLEAQNLTIYDAFTQGIAFETDGQGKVTAVIVHRPGHDATISQVELP